MEPEPIHVPSAVKQQDFEDASSDVELVFPSAKSRIIDEDTNQSISFLDVLRIVAGLVLLSSILSYFFTGDSLIWGFKAWWTTPRSLVSGLVPNNPDASRFTQFLTILQKGPIVLTDDALAAYNGRDPSLPIYLALNGTIYDVTANPGMYGPGGMYSVFAARDASRGFVSGCFAEDNVPDLRGQEWQFVPQDIPRFEEKSDEELGELMATYRREKIENGLKEVEKAIQHWQKVFRGETGKKYFEVGYVKRDARAMEKEPVRALCANAERKRPKAKFETWMQERRVKKAKATKAEKEEL